MSRRRFVKKKKGTKAEQALRIAKSNQKTIRRDIEYLSTDATFAAAALAATPTVTHLPLGSIAGPKGVMKSIQLRGKILQNLASALNDDWRVDLVLDRLPGNALPTVVEIYTSATPEIYAYKSIAERSRFKILRSWKGILNESNKTFEMLEFYSKLNLICVVEGSSFANISTYLKNSIVLVKWTTATANQPTFEAFTRITTIDEN